jgi:hypothetical protein
VYATGGVSPKEGIKALVLVSFDPGIFLKGVQSFEGGHDPIPRAVSDLSPTLRSVQAPVDTGKRKDEAKETSRLYSRAMNQADSVVEHSITASSGSAGLTSEAGETARKTGGWLTVEPAQYIKIGQGLHLAK